MSGWATFPRPLSGCLLAPGAEMRGAAAGTKARAAEEAKLEILEFEGKKLELQERSWVEELG